MNSYELTNQIDEFLLEIDQNHYISGINILSQMFDKVSNALEKAIEANKSEQINSAFTSAKNILNQTIHLEKEKIDIFKFYEDGHKIQKALKVLSECMLPENETVFPSLLNRIENSLVLYKKHIRTYNHLSLYALLKEARTIKNDINAIVSLYKPLKNTLLGDVFDDQLVIVLGEVSEVNKYSLKLQSLQNAYDELCHYCNVEASDFPLSIIKLETGSPWYIKLAGHPAIMAILTSSLTLGVTYVHEKYISSSEIEEIPKVAKAANEVLQLTENLKKQGFEVDIQMEELNKLSVKLAKQLNNIVTDQANMEINGNIHSVPDAQTKKYLNETKKLEHDNATEK